VQNPTVRGLGSTLIENGIPGATVERKFGKDGFVCTIKLALPEGHDRGEQQQDRR
jgi:two-component system CheB/CheR fusion protein